MEPPNPHPAPARPDALATLHATDEATLDARWTGLVAWLSARFEREITIEAALFLIGIQERGQGFEPKLAKQRKQDLIMEGTYCAFETLGLYERAGMEEDGFWIWERTQRLPDLSVEAQEKLLRLAIVTYFDPVLPPSS